MNSTAMNTCSRAGAFDAALIRGRFGLLIGACALLMASLSGCGSSSVMSEKVDLVWPAPPEPTKIRYVTSLVGSQDFKVQKRNKLISLIIGDGGTERMLKPYGVAADNTRVYVTDTGLGALWVFNQDTREVTLFGTGGQGELILPSGVCPGDSGTVYVSDSDQGRVFQYGSNGDLIQAFGGGDALVRPVGVAYDSGTGRLVVADSKLHQIMVFDAVSGDLISRYGERGDSTGQFNFPTNISLRGGRLYITDTGNFRIQVLDLDGHFLTSFGKVGDGLGDFARPKGIGVDSEGHIYVADAAFDNFQIFNDDGQLLLFVGSTGQEPGKFWLPAGLWVDNEDKIYVVDSYNQRVQIFQYAPEPSADTALKAEINQIESNEE